MKKLSPKINLRSLAALAIVLAWVGAATADNAGDDVEAAFRTAENNGRQANEQHQGASCTRYPAFAIV